MLHNIYFTFIDAARLQRNGERYVTIRCPSVCPRVCPVDIPALYRSIFAADFRAQSGRRYAAVRRRRLDAELFTLAPLVRLFALYCTADTELL